MAADGFDKIAIVSDIRGACLAATLWGRRGENRLFPDHALGPRCV